MKKEILILLLLFLMVCSNRAQELVLLETENTEKKSESKHTNDHAELRHDEPTVCFEFQVYDYSTQMEQLSGSRISPNFFGEQIARKMKVFCDLYTYEVPVGPGSPASKTVIRKPSIYKATKMLYKFYKQEVKTEHLTIDEARDAYELILNISMSAIHEQTADFERDLGKTKQPENMLQIFRKVKLVN